jgi:ABC-type Fe3+-hydroxamate transport system substrate-binding protein
MRIASLQPSITLTLAALNRLDALCAITKYCLEALPELAARNLPVLQDSWSFDKSGNLETLLAAQPNIVIASVPYRMESLAAILKSGVPVLALAPHSLADIYADTRLIAAQVQADPEPLIANMQRTLAETRARTAHIPLEQRPLIYCEEWANRSSTRNTGSPNWSKPPAPASLARPDRTPRPKMSPLPIPTSSSLPGAEQAIASHSTASSPSATGSLFAPSITTASTASRTSS